MSIFWIKFTPRLHLGNQQKIHLWMMTFTYQTGQGRNTLGFDKLPARNCSAVHCKSQRETFLQKVLGWKTVLAGKVYLLCRAKLPSRISLGKSRLNFQTHSPKNKKQISIRATEQLLRLYNLQLRKNYYGFCLLKQEERRKPLTDRPLVTSGPGYILGTGLVQIDCD